MQDFDEHTDLSQRQQEQLLDDLELRCQTHVAELRDGHRQLVRVRADVHAGNACDRRHGALSTFHGSELTATTATGIADRPVMVGSVFQLVFDRRDLDLPPALAVCERCSMLGETSFELRFRFVRPLDLGDE